MLSAVASIAISHPRRVAGAVAILFVIAIAVGSGASNSLTARNDFADPGSQSAHARVAVERATGATPEAGVLVLVRAPRASTEVAGARSLLASDRAVAAVSAPLASSTGTTTLLEATLRANV